ncbi:MAG: 2'-5' RNA ligase family protein [Myxococcota bacterium]
MANWFIALPVPAEAWFAALAPVPDVVRPFHPDDLHATVAFLGACGEARARRAFAALRTEAIPVRRVTLTEIVPMGPPRKWSALSAEVVDARDERPALADLLVGPRDRGLAAAEVRPEKRRMRPHVTVGRVTRKSGGAGRKAGLQWAQSVGRIGATVTVDRLALYTWAPRPATRHFTIVEARPLGTD